MGWRRGRRGTSARSSPCSTPEVELTRWEPGEWDCHGREDVLALLRERKAEGKSSAEVELIDAGEDAIIATRATTVPDGPAAGLRPATLITFRNGRVIAMRQFRDRGEALAARGPTNADQRRAVEMSGLGSAGSSPGRFDCITSASPTYYNVWPGNEAQANGENWQMIEGRIEVRLTPRASSNRLMGIADGILRARVTAPPVDDRANKALCQLIAKRIEIAPSKVVVVRGAKSRIKTVRVKGRSAATLAQALRASDR